MSFAAWMTPAEHARWRKTLRADYAQIRQPTGGGHTALSFGLENGNEWATPTALALLTEGSAEP